MSKRRWNRVGNLFDLCGQVSFQNELVREALEEHRLVNAEAPPSRGMHVDFTVAVGDRGAGLIPLQSPEAAPRLV